MLVELRHPTRCYNCVIDLLEFWKAARHAPHTEPALNLICHALNLSATHVPYLTIVHAHRIPTLPGSEFFILPGVSGEGGIGCK